MGKHTVVKADAKPCERFYFPARVNQERSSGYRLVPPTYEDDPARVKFIDELRAKRAARAAEGRG